MTPDVWLARWDLVPDGAAITTPSSLLLPVRQRGQPALLKIAREEEERRGGRLMAWWDGDGAARVLAHDDRALLLERIAGPRTLAAMVAAGDDDEASRILCAVAGRLHVPRRGPPPELVPLSRWFEALAPAARSHGGLLAEAEIVGPITQPIGAQIACDLVEEGVARVGEALGDVEDRPCIVA